MSGRQSREEQDPDVLGVDRRHQTSDGEQLLFLTVAGMSWLESICLATMQINSN